MQKFENKDFFGKGFLTDISKDAEILIKSLDDIEKKLKDVAKVQANVLNSEDNKTVESIKKTNEAVKVLSDSEKVALKIQEDKRKLELKLKELNSNRVQQNEELKLQISDQIKNNKKLAKEALGLVSAFDRQKDRLKELQKRYKDLAAEQKENSKEANELLEEITSLDKSIKKIEKSSKGLVGAFQQQKDQLSDLRQEYQDLVAAQGPNAVGAEELLKQITKLDKRVKETQKNSRGLTDEYSRQSARLNDLRKEYKNLILIQGEATAETDELLREITKLDKALKEVDANAGQFQRSVGNYEKINQGAKRSFSSLSGFLLGIVAGSFSKSRAEAREFSITIEKLKNTVGVFVNAAIIFFNEKARPTIENFFDAIQKRYLQFENTIKSVSAFLGDDEASADIEKNKAKIEELNISLEKNRKIIESSENPFAGITDRISESNTLLEEQLKLEDRILDRTALLNKQIVKLAGEQERLSAIAGDTTRSFSEQNEAAEEALVVQAKRLKLENEIAKSNERVALLAIKNDLLRKQALDGVTDQQITSLNFLKDQNLADKVSIENIERIKEVSTQLQELENERLAFELESQRTIDEIRRDAFERELDFAIDAFDAQKTVNERRIADERLTLAERRSIFDQTTELAEKSFQNQIKLVQDFTKKNIDLNSLAQESDEEAIRARLAKFSFDDITLGRILEIIKERKLANQDLADSQRDLNEADLEALKLQRDIILQEEQLNNPEGSDLDSLEEKRRDEEIAFLKERLEVVKQGSIEELRIRKELNDLLLQEQKELASEEDKLREDQLQKEKKLREDLINVISDTFNDAFAKQLNAIDERLSKSQERTSELIQKAENARLATNESVAFERKAQEELELKREKIRKKQERTQALFSVLQAFNSNDGDLGKTITDVAVLRGIAESLTGFYEGTDDTGSTGKIRDKDGWITGYTHENEMVLNNRETSELKSLGYGTRKAIIEGLKEKKNFNSNPIDINPVIITRKKDENFNSSFNRELKSSIDKMNATLQGMEADKIEIDSVRNLLIHTSKVGNSRKKTISKLH